MKRSIGGILGVFCAGIASSSVLFGAAEESASDWANEGNWPRGPLSVENTPDKQAAKAKRFQEIGDSRQSAEQYRRLADVYSESDLAEEGLVLSARNYLAAGDYTKCRDQLTELRRRYANPSFLDAIGEVEIALGRGYLEGKGEGGTYRLKSRLRKAEAIFKRQFDNDPEGRWADDALFGLGQVAETLFDYDTAIKKYKELLEKYPRSELRAEAEGHIAACINKREPQPEYTESETEEARRRIQQAKDEALAEDVDLDLVALEENEKLLSERQARKRYEQALFYMKNNRFRAAEVYFELIKARYPQSTWAEKAAAELEKLRRR
ncbi:MAG TPA: tetratricopeptide repeat protein [Planctomycetota bacterium]|nr:tetratricopeptide repeat protein [Planctomycetota bacterium]